MFYLGLYTINFYVLLIFSLVWVLCLRFFATSYSSRLVLTLDVLLILGLALIVSYDISVRPIDHYGDTFAYYQFYEDLVAGIVGPFDKAFVYLAKFLVYLESPYIVFFWVVPFFLMVSYYVLAIVFFNKQSAWPVILIVVLVVSPFFLSLSANIIRQGMAIVFLTLSISMVLRQKKRISWCMFVIAFLFHKSVLICLPFMLWAPQLSRLPMFSVFCTWMIVSVASFGGWFAALSTFIFNKLSEQGVSINYSDLDDVSYETGFRWDFWFFSSLPLIVLYVYKKIVLEASFKGVAFMTFLTYLGVVHIGMLDVAYNDRFGIYAWYYYPFLIVLILRVAAANMVNGYKIRLNKFNFV